MFYMESLSPRYHRGRYWHVVLFDMGTLPPLGHSSSWSEPVCTWAEVLYKSDWQKKASVYTGIDESLKPKPGAAESHLASKKGETV